jgi:hypothetical protein
VRGLHDAFHLSGEDTIRAEDPFREAR